MGGTTQGVVVVVEDAGGTAVVAVVEDVDGMAVVVVVAVMEGAGGTVVVGGVLRVQVRARRRRPRVWVVDWKAENLGLAVGGPSRIVNRNERGRPRDGG